MHELDLTDARSKFGSLLQTLYREASQVKDMEKGEGFGRTNPIVDSYNDALQQARELFPENQSQIASLPTIGKAPTRFGIDSVNEAKGKVQEAYFAIVRLAQILEIPLKEPLSSQAPLVQLAITQQVSQFVYKPFSNSRLNSN